MDEELDKVKKRIEKRLEQYDRNEYEGAPFNDAIDHFQRIEGGMNPNTSRLNRKSMPTPIRIIGYLLIGSMVAGGLIGTLLNWFR